MNEEPAEKKDEEAKNLTHEKGEALEKDADFTEKAAEKTAEKNDKQDKA